MSVGMCLNNFTLSGKQPGWDSKSWGWHGDDGERKKESNNLLLVYRHGDDGEGYTLRVILLRVILRHEVILGVYTNALLSPLLLPPKVNCFMGPDFPMTPKRPV